MIAILAFATISNDFCAEPIRPTLVGSNLWLADRNNSSTTPSGTVMTLAGQAGIRFIRIGGNEFDSNMPSNAALLTWINRIRAVGAEPLIQVSQFRTPAQAAATVEFLNITSGANITYWSIGNEPWLRANNVQNPDPTESQIAATIEGYFKPISVAMKAVDPSIKIFGVDSEDFQGGLHARLFGGSNNIAGKIPGQDYYYCDGLSWHRYPQATGIDPALEGLADFRSRIEGCRALIDSVNASEGRTGDAALVWGIGEFNSKNGAAVHTWGNGQMFAGVYGLAMKHGATFASSWSLFESNGARTNTDYSLFDGTGLVRRPSYWHTQLVSQNFSGRYLEGNPSLSSNTSELLVFGAEDAARGQTSVMIMNRGYTPRSYTLHLNNNGTFASDGATAINVDASSPESRDGTIDARSTRVLVFRRDSVTEVNYTNEHFIASQGPQTTVTPRSPLAGLFDGFNYLGIAEHGYWNTLHVGSGLASVADSQLVLRASDTAYASATLGSPVHPAFNFFKRGFVISLENFEQSAKALELDATQFRLCLNSTSNRTFGSDDSLVLRVNPASVRLGYKINQTGVHGEMRAGVSTAAASLMDFNYSGTIRTIRLSLEPAGGASTVTYHLQLDGSFGRIVRTGNFTADIADWGNDGDSALVLESRRDSAVIGGAESFAEAKVGDLYIQPLVLDDFNDYTAFSDQTYWHSLLVGATSTLQLAGGSAVLSARASSFSSAAIAGTIIPELNFFQRGFTLDFNGLALTHENLPPEEAFFRISLCSTSQRSFTTPDSFTLRLAPQSLRIGYKIDQPSADAELRTGTTNTTSSLIDIPISAPATQVRLTLIPMGPPSAATPVFFAIRLITSAGEVVHTGNFTADSSRWGTAGDSSLVLEARRASATNTDNTSFMRAGIDAVNFLPIPDDFFATSPNFTTWRLAQFNHLELEKPAISGSTATPADDGVSNLLKYAFGLDAKLPAMPGFLPWVSAVVEELPAFVHRERAGASDLYYQVEASTDLMNWNIPVMEVTRSAAVAGWISVSTRAILPDNPQRTFYRARVQKP